MQTLLGPQIQQNIQPSPAECRSCIGRAGRTEETGFDTVLQGILGVSGQQSQTTASSCTSSPNINQAFTINSKDDLKLLSGIMQKLSVLLGSKTKTANTAALKELMSSSLTEEEVAFIQQFLQNISTANTAGETAAAGTDSSLESFLACIDQQTAAGSDQSCFEMLENLLSSLNTIIDKTVEQLGSGQAANGTDQDFLQTLQDSEGGQDILPLLTSLRDKLQQIYNGFARAPEQTASDHMTKFSLYAPGGQNTETVAATDGQPLVTVSEGAGQPDTTVQTGQNNQTGQTPLNQQQTAAGEDPLKNLIEQFLMEKKGLQQLSFSSDAAKNMKQEITANALMGKIAESIVKGPDQNTNSIMSLFDQSGMTKNMVSPLQVEAKPAVDQLLSRLQTINTFGSSPDIALKTEGTELLEAVKPAENNSGPMENGFGGNTMLKDAVVTDQAGQAPSGADKAPEAGGRFMEKMPVNSAYILEQMADKMHMAMRSGQQKLSMQLYPPSLGKIQVELSVRSNELKAVILTESSQVKQLLDTNIDQLKACLQSQNIKVENISVMVGGDGTRQQFDQFASNLHERTGRGKKNSFLNTLKNTGGEMDAISGIAPYTRSIIRQDMVDVFA